MHPDVASNSYGLTIYESHSSNLGAFACMNVDLTIEQAIVGLANASWVRVAHSALQSWNENVGMDSVFLVEQSQSL